MLLGCDYSTESFIIHFIILIHITHFIKIIIPYLRPDDDYNPVTRTITFPAGVTSQTVPVDTLDDFIDENDESFSASLFNPMGSGLPFVLGDDDTATANIMDTDSMYNKLCLF